MSSTIAVILGLLPGIVWLIFFLQEDRQYPEPKKLILYVFFLGAVVTFLVLQIQIVLNNWLTSVGVSQWSALSVFWLAATEEIAKFLVVFLAVRRLKDFNEAIDPMIYMIVAALGFASVENIASALKSVNNFELITLRFVGATLLHSLSSGLVGYWWALSIYHKRHHVSDIIIGLSYAIVFHAIFNYLVIKWGPGINITLLLIFIAFFVLYDFEKLKNIKEPLPNNSA